jgi:hypothetical protein
MLFSLHTHRNTHTNHGSLPPSPPSLQMSFAQSPSLLPPNTHHSLCHSHCSWWQPLPVLLPLVTIALFIAVAIAFFVACTIALFVARHSSPCRNCNCRCQHSIWCLPPLLLLPLPTSFPTLSQSPLLSLSQHPCCRRHRPCHPCPCTLRCHCHCSCRCRQCPLRRCCHCSCQSFYHPLSPRRHSSPLPSLLPLKIP